MRWPTVLTVVVAAGVAHARPASKPDLLEPYDPPGARCDSGKSWPKLHTCLQRTGSVQMLYDLPAAKLVTVHLRDDASSSVQLFLLREGMWRKANVYSTVGPGNEVLSFKRLTKARGYRLDVGSILATSAAVGDSTMVPIMLRRIVSTVCLDDNGYCRTLVTRCEAMIDGKTYWSYRGDLVAEKTNLRLVGDSSRAGTVCAPAKAFTSQHVEGDPLE